MERTFQQAGFHPAGGDSGRLHREEKLLFLCVLPAFAVGTVSAITGDGAIDLGEIGRWSLFALLIPIHLWLRRHPPATATLLYGLAAVALVAGAVSRGIGGSAWPAPLFAVVAGAMALAGLPRLSPTGRWIAGAAALAGIAAGVLAFIGQPAVSQPSGREWYERAGWLGLAVLLLSILVPFRRFAPGRGGGPGSVGALGAAGTILVGAYAVAAVLRPVFDGSWTLGFYLLLLCLLYVSLRRQEREHYATPVTRAQTLSVTLITKNEADRVERCLRSVHGWADEIVVLDSGSTDDTVEIVRRYTDRAEVTDWPGYGPQKQRALERATCDWVLSIDADEEMTPELRHDIDRALGAAPECVGYKLPWGVFLYGKLLDFGRSARAPLRLFVREGSRFTDAQVHETILLPPGKVGRLHGRLLHYTQRDFGHALDKNAEYGWLGAKQRFAAGKRAGGLVGATLRGLLTFFQVYVVRLGMLDGQPGFLQSVLYAQVAFNKYAGLWALRRASRASRGK